MPASEREPRKAPRLSRRDMISGGLALAAGYVASVTIPQPAIAANGDGIVVGGVRVGSLSSLVLRTTDGTMGGAYQVWADLCHDDGGALSPMSGVFGYSTTVSPHGSSGVRGSTSSPNQYGVHATTDAAYGTALKADCAVASGTAVRAIAPIDGVGVDASAPAGATALNVYGRAAFSRSGVGSVAKKKKSATVTVPSGLATTALVFATLQNAGSGVYLASAARISTTQFRVNLNKKAPNTTRFAWFVVG